jgi:excinuclease ABC subunit A
MRTTLLIQGARENNLRNITVEFPRNKLVVITGVSGSGKSSLAFDTLYAEGQRRLLASMSAYAKRFVNQLRKPDVDFVNGLSPVISIDQKTVGSNPRSTVGTMTDLWDYLRMLYATLGTPYCPRCQEPVAARSPRQMLERMLQLPAGTPVELRAPVFEIYGENWEYVFEEVRLQGYRRVRVDGVERDLGSQFELGEDEYPFVEAILDRFVVGPGIDRHVLAAIENGSKVGDGFFSFHAEGLSSAQLKKFWKDFGCAEHHLISATLHHGNFTFNDPAALAQGWEPLNACIQRCLSPTRPGVWATAPLSKKPSITTKTLGAGAGFTAWPNITGSALRRRFRNCRIPLKMSSSTEAKARRSRF